MKITNELGNKIISCVDKKYEATLLKIRHDITEEKKNKIDRYVAVAEKASAEYPEIGLLFSNYGYRAMNVADGVKGIISNKLSSIDDDIKTLLNLEKEIIDKKKEEIENIKIQISYGKTFDDIKGVFSEYGFEF